MPTSNDTNAKIALARGWRVERRRALDMRGQPIVWKGEECYQEDWYDPDDQYQGHRPPDSVGTSEGVAMMLRELRHWHVYWVTVVDTWHMLPMWREKITRHGAGAWVCMRYRDGIGVADDFFTSPFEKPGHCVGEAYLAKLRKEATGAKD